MFFQMLLFCWSFVLDVLAVSRMTNPERDLEIMVLRQQLRIVERRQQRGPRIARWQKVPLVALVWQLSARVSHAQRKLEDSLLLFKPATLLHWHRELVRGKWTYRHQRKAGRPAH